MEYLRKLLHEINNYDGSNEATNRLRNLVCFISDNDKYKKDDLYREVLFSAAQKMRTFGYNIQNYIGLSEIGSKGLYDIKHQAIQKYYASEVDSNKLLDKRQKDIVEYYMSLDIKRLIISAPTSFGKTFLLREILYLNRERYNNILLVFPTVALLNENTVEIRKFIKEKELDYTVVNNVYSKVDINSRSIYILTPERTLKLLSGHENLNIDFFFFDEVYKIDEDFCNDENDSEMSSGIKDDNPKKNNRAKAFRITLYILSKAVKEYYIAGPYLNLNNVKLGFKKYLLANQISVKQVDFEPTLRIEIDAWNKKGIEHHPILGDIPINFNYETTKTKDKIGGVIKYLENNELGQAIFYCSSPGKSMSYVRDIIEVLDNNSEFIQKYGHFIKHLKKRYGIRHNTEGKTILSSDYWSLVHILSAGYGVHHGKFPKYVQKEILNMFNYGDIKYLFCTSTIIEGVNTNAKNVVVINNSVGGDVMTSFALKNIKGRAGRYYHHFIGRVFYIDKKQREIEVEGEMRLNFSIYDEIPLSKVDYDNAEIKDLAKDNLPIKRERENSFDKNKLPDRIFVKNRLYPRDLQEKYLNYLLQQTNFNKFKSLIANPGNIQVFLNERMMNKILESFCEVEIIDESTKTRYFGIVTNYSIKRFKGLMSYQLQENLQDPKKDIDKIYLTVFEQIKNIIEYEIPKLLCLFEVLYKQASELKCYEMDTFDMSPIIRFFELGVKTQLGIYLVEYGYPIDAIKDIEDLLPDLSGKELAESMKYVLRNVTILNQRLDEYEKELLRKALDAAK